MLFRDVEDFGLFAYVVEVLPASDTVFRDLDWPYPF